LWRSKISLHREKAGYSYPTIRLPHTFSKLIGLPSRIYQTVHEGALAFLVIISPTENRPESPESPALTWRSSPVLIQQSPSFFLQSAAAIRADHGDNEDEKSHNSDAAEDSEERTDDDSYYATTQRYLEKRQRQYELYAE
jgi:hypothetical protein